jgi:hypothetical protein
MSRNRKWWHKANHDRVLRDQFVWNLPDEALGLLTRIQCMTGSTERGHETGVLCSEAGDKMSADELAFLLSRGDAEQEARIMHRLSVLARAKQICPRALERGQIKLLHWQEDQEMPASQDGERKRSEADERMAEEVQAFRPDLVRFFAKLGNRAVTDGELLSFIKAVTGKYSKTQNKFLEFLWSEGVLARDADGLNRLASLAPPAPAGVGFSGGGAASPTLAGTGEENFPNGKFPVEIDPDPETDIDLGMRIHSQLDSAGDGGGAGGASEAGDTGSRERPAFCRTPSAASGSPPDASGDKPCQFVLQEPGDAWRCSDVLAASIEFLSRCPGWQEKRYGNNPSSSVVLRSKWRELRENPHVGPEEAERIWRACLDGAITDKLDRQGWKSWVAIFMKRMRVQVDVLKPMGVK